MLFESPQSLAYNLYKNIFTSLTELMISGSKGSSYILLPKLKQHTEVHEMNSITLFMVEKQDAICTKKGKERERERELLNENQEQ